LTATFVIMKRTVVVVLVLLTACKQWQPSYVPEGTGSEINPTVSFRRLVDCQQYLKNRFGNQADRGTMYCTRGGDRQIVGQTGR
jgi:hypothetical protein